LRPAFSVFMSTS